MCIICAGMITYMCEDKILDEHIVKYYRHKVTSEVYDNLTEVDPSGGFGVLLYLVDQFEKGGHSGPELDKLKADVVASCRQFMSRGGSKFTPEMLEKLEEDLKKGKVQ